MTESWPSEIGNQTSTSACNAEQWHAACSKPARECKSTTCSAWGMPEVEQPAGMEPGGTPRVTPAGHSRVSRRSTSAVARCSADVRRDTSSCHARHDIVRELVIASRGAITCQMLADRGNAGARPQLICLPGPLRARLRPGPMLQC